MQLDSIYLNNRIEEMSSLSEWFLSNDIVKNKNLNFSYFIQMNIIFYRFY